MKHLKKFWKHYLLGALAASAASLYMLDPKTGKPVDPNNFDVPSIVDPQNGRTIDFGCADADNTGETLIIKADNCNYQIFDWQYGYYSASNVSPDDQNYDIRVLDSNGIAVKTFEEFKPQVPYLVDVNDYGPNKIECTDGWTENKAGIMGGVTYSCGKDVPVSCDKIDGTTCLQDNVVIGTHQETKYQDEWGSITENPKPTKDASIDSKYKPSAQIQFWIPSGETKYFRVVLKAPKSTSGKFYITAKGSLGSYGTLDPAWYSNSWAYRIPIVINHNKVASTTGDVYTSFPILASTTNTSLKTTANGGHVGKTDGTDILFTLSDGTTKLNHELEYYASTTGQLLAWVNMGTGNLSTSTDTTIYAYYGNAAASDQQSVTATWDSNYKGVWHLPNGTTLSANDSTGVNNGTLSATPPTAGTGQIDGGAVLGTNKYIDNASPTGFPSGSGAITTSIWVKMSSDANNSIMTLGDNIHGDGGRWQMTYVSPNLFWVEMQNVAPQVTLTYDTNWHYLVSVNTAGNTDVANVKMYIDGVSKTVTKLGTATINFTPNDFRLGGVNWDSSVIFNGTEDEARVSNIARSADWIKTEYNNQFSPQTFETWGSEEYSGQVILSGYGQYRTLVIDHNQVASSTSETYSTFPMVVSSTLASLKTVSNGGKVTSDSGYDIQFATSTTPGNPALAYEREIYASTTGNILVHINTKGLSTSTDTTLYMLYGNSTITTDVTSNPVVTWDTNYKGVWHFPNGTALTANDSTATGANGSVVGSVTATAGKIDGGLQNTTFGGDNEVRVSDNAALRITQKITLSAWVNPVASNSNGGLVLQKRNATDGGAGENYAMWLVSLHPYFEAQNPNGTYNSVTATGAVSTNTWSLVTIVIDETAGTKIRFYINGVQDSTPAYPSSMPAGNTDPLQFSSYGQLSGIYYLDGSMDEVRISNIPRSADWIKTEYNNQSAPDKTDYGSTGFYSFGGEVCLINCSVSIPGVTQYNGSVQVNNGSVKINGQ